MDPFQYDIDGADHGATIETIRAVLLTLPQTSRFAEQAPSLLDTLAERYETNGVKKGKWQALQRYRGRVTGSTPLVITGDTSDVVQGKYGGEAANYAGSRDPSARVGLSVGGAMLSPDRAGELAKPMFRAVLAEESFCELKNP